MVALLVAANSAATAATAATGDPARTAARLAEVRGRIAALTGRLGAELADRDALAARLREADLGITARRQRLETLNRAQRVAERRRAELSAEQSRDQASLEAQRAALAAQVRAAYMIGRQEQLQLLLNQSDPAAVGRTLAYYGYFARERSAKIDDIRGRVDRVRQLMAEIEAQTATLGILQNDTAREMLELQRARMERVAAFGAVSRQVRSGHQELTRLKREEQAEETLLAELSRVLEDFPIDSQQSFDGLRGKLPWPVQGKMSVRYQDTRLTAQSGLRWNGVSIETTRGAKVRAPYFGRVVYADWLQGLGLLLIIGHSGNYLTLYGHAEVLYKSVGDWVSPGDVIAALSDSNGAAPQLYFEIRDGRKPVDPKVWLKASP